MTGFFMKCNTAQKCSITVSNNKITRECIKMCWHHLESFLPGTSFMFVIKSPHILRSPPISNFVHISFPCVQLRLPVLFLLPCFFGWMGECTTFYLIFLNDIMDLHTNAKPWYLTTRRTLFYATRFQFCRGLARSMFFCWCSKLLSHTHTQLKTHNTYKYILTPPVLRSQQFSALHWMNNSLIGIKNW